MTCAFVSETRLFRKTVTLFEGTSSQKTKFVLWPVVDRVPVRVSIL